MTLRLSQDAFGTNNWITRDRANNYTYDDNGNITSIREIRNSNQYQCFTYDQIDRLLTAYTDNTSACNGHTAVGQGNFNDTYTYSRGGDLITHTGTGEGSQRGTYTYGDPNLAHAVTGISDGSAFAYDDNGNMVIRNLAGETAQTLTWDEGRRLAEVNQGGTTVAEFLYAIDDSRVRRVTDDGTATYYLLDGSEYTEGPDGNYFTYYHQINGRTVAFTRGDTSETTWMASDIVNSTAVTRDENGVVNTQRYTPFGETRNNGDLETDHLYTGQVFDESSGLAFYNARYYDPAIGRFITPDNIVPDRQNGQDYNLYSYVRNNPIRYEDPSGNFCAELGFGKRWCLVDPIEISQINEVGQKTLDTLPRYTCADDANVGQCIGDVPGSVQTVAGYIGAGCAGTLLAAPYSAPLTGPCTGAAETTAIAAGATEAVFDCGGAVVAQSGGSECATSVTDLAFDIATGPGTQPAKLALESLVTPGRQRSVVGSIVDQILWDHGIPARYAERAADIVEKYAPVAFPVIKELVPDSVIPQSGAAPTKRSNNGGLYK